MSTGNPFDLLGLDENDDPSQLILASEQLKQAATAAKKAPPQTAAQAKPGKLPTKPLPPSQAVKEARHEGGQGGARGTGRGRGHGRGGSEINRVSFKNDSTYGGPPVPYKVSEEGEAGKTFERQAGYGGPRRSFRGGRRGGFSDGDAPEGERPQRVYERHSGTGRDNGFKRDGAGRGNWGTPTDEIALKTEEAPIQREKVEDAEKQFGDEDVSDMNKEKTEEEIEKEIEAKEMTLEEYEKILEEKRKALLALKTEERKVDDKEFKSMQQISSKKNNDEIFVKLGSEKDKRKEVAEKEERAKKSVSITEFLKPAEGERSYGRSGRGRGRGSRGGFNGGSYNNTAPPANIEDPGHFPALGVK
ncbi:unnamed protein product [Rhodiola kirilowii]